MKTTNRYTLEQVGKRIPFDVPSTYFDEFSQRIESITTGQKVPFRKMMKPWMYMAAMFTGLLITGNVLLQVHKNKNIQLQQAEAYEAYLLSQVDESVYYDYYFEEVAPVSDNTTIK